jgi:hypothetical protein
MIVFGPLLVVFFLLEKTEMLSALDLASLSILSFRDAVLES